MAVQWDPATHPCPQAWIQNAKLKDNILFGSPDDPARYEAAIDDCALAADLDILPAKDTKMKPVAHSVGEPTSYGIDLPAHRH